jgi:DNA-directed RNA polymerase subunit M/transcription elongation factor TFIIS
MSFSPNKLRNKTTEMIEKKMREGNLDDEFSKLSLNESQDISLKNFCINVEKTVFNYSCKKIVGKQSWSNEDFKRIYMRRAIECIFKAKIIYNTIISKERTFEDYETISSRDIDIHNWDSIRNYLDSREQAKKEAEKPKGKGLHKCGKCKSWETSYTEKQTRSADEPTTKFVTCHNCDNRWKYS